MIRMIKDEMNRWRCKERRRIEEEKEKRIRIFFSALPVMLRKSTRWQCRITLILHQRRAPKAGARGLRCATSGILTPLHIKGRPFKEWQWLWEPSRLTKTSSARKARSRAAAEEINITADEGTGCEREIETNLVDWMCLQRLFHIKKIYISIYHKACCDMLGDWA